MYERFYGLRELPFELPPNPDYLFLTARHSSALSNLQYGITARRGITLLIGEEGTGKTTVIQAALDLVRRDKTGCVYLNNPTLTRAEFMACLAHEFDLGEEAKQSKPVFLRELERVLLARLAKGEVSALLIDEGERLSRELLEETRLLADMEISNDKLLPVVLAGQPELADRLNEPSLRQLKQRVTSRCDLAPLEPQETAGYVAARIELAGGKAGDIFTRAAIEAIHTRSRGIPRTINVICDKALLSGFAAGHRPVDWEVVLEVCGHLDFGQSEKPALERQRAVVNSSPNSHQVTAETGTPAAGRLRSSTKAINRLEEGLRRARGEPNVPESFASLDAEALNHFPASDAQTGGSVSALPLEFEQKGDSGDSEPDLDAARPAAASSSSANGHTPIASPEPNTAFGGKLVISDDVKAVTVEQYRRLAATLHQAQCNDGVKIVMIASALAGEGKTLTAANLALTLSESYARRVLLIDADLRRPTLHEVFQLSNVSGLNDGLKADAYRKLTALEISPRLSLLPAGTPDPDPMRALTSERMRRVLEEAAAKYDWVVIDTPPVALLPDAHLLAAMVNVVVLVVQAARTPCALIQRAVESLDRKRVIGVVLNWVDDRATSPGGKYEQYYASSYGRPSSLNLKAQS